MGTIRIGRSGDKVYEQTPFGVNIRKQEPAAPSIDDKERKAIIKEIMARPKEEHVAALREAGLVKEADELEQKYANEHIKELQVQARAKRLKEIRQLSDEEQLPLLLDEGYEEEAAELSEKIEADKRAAEEAAKAEAEAMAKAEAEKAAAEKAAAEKAENEKAAAEKAADEKSKKGSTPKAETPAKAKTFNFDGGKTKKSRK
jgi:colicin import membrane protein